MEEEVKKMKVVRKSENKEPKEESKKLTYEELSNACVQLSNQNREMYNTIRKISQENFFKRLDYLFKLLSNYSMFEDDIIEQTIKEITTMMFPPEESEDKGHQNEDSK